MKDKGEGRDIRRTFVQQEANHVQRSSRTTELNFGQHLRRQSHE